MESSEERLVMTFVAGLILRIDKNQLTHQSGCYSDNLKKNNNGDDPNCPKPIPCVNANLITLAERSALICSHWGELRESRLG